MSTTAKDLREGIRQALTDAALATTSQVFWSKMPTTPDRVVVISWYPVSVPHVEGVQLRIRGKAGSNTDAEDWANQIRAALHGLSDLTWGDTVLDTLAWVSGAPMGYDGTNRQEVALNFYATTSAPSISLVD